MNFALNEVEAMAKKASRGAGYSWGMAEEAAKASRWLCANGIDGVNALAVALLAADGSDPKWMVPQTLDEEWRAQSGTICPLMAGATLSDFAGVGPEISVGIVNVVAPILLLPFAANAARQFGCPVTVARDGVLATTDGKGLALSGAQSAVSIDIAPRVTVQRTGQIGAKNPPQTRATPSDAGWAALGHFAHRTYAPATDESRLKGAGAGLSDND